MSHHWNGSGRNDNPQFNIATIEQDESMQPSNLVGEIDERVCFTDVVKDLFQGVNLDASGLSVTMTMKLAKHATAFGEDCIIDLETSVQHAFERHLHSLPDATRGDMESERVERVKKNINDLVSSFLTDARTERVPELICSKLGVNKETMSQAGLEQMKMVCQNYEHEAESVVAQAIDVDFDKYIMNIDSLLRPAHRNTAM